MATQINTPVGRIVSGHPAKPQIKKDQRTKQPIIKDGQQVQQWYFGVAFPKADFAQCMAQLNAEAATAYPNGVPQGFSWKIKDGDGVDRTGKPYSAREGHAGCWIIAITTEAFAPRLFKHEGGAYVQIGEQEIKCGDFVALALTAKVNVPTDRTHTPGLYINPSAVVRVGFGTEIVTGGIDPAEAFGAAPQWQLPPGASATPIGPSAMPGGAPQPPQQGYQQPPQQGYQQPPVAPAHDFVQNAGQQPGQGGAPQYAQQPPQGFQMPSGQQPQPGPGNPQYAQTGQFSTGAPPQGPGGYSGNGQR